MGHLLDKKICLVTGAGKGIGQAIAEQFAQEGAMVFANALHHGSIEQWLINSPYKDSIIPLYFDIASPNEVKQAMMQIKHTYECLDVVVNNAGVEFNEIIGMISRSNMEKMFQVNVFGMIDVLQFASRIMMRQKNGGSIINISSNVGLFGNPGQLVYSATKGAVIALTKSAAKELAKYQIRVNSIAPGLTKTSMLEAADLNKIKKRIDNIGFRRLAEPYDIAQACIFFASDLSDYVSGQILAVDGCTVM